MFQLEKFGGLAALYLGLAYAAGIARHSGVVRDHPIGLVHLAGGGLLAALTRI